MSDFKATFDQARKRLRHKLGLPAAVPPNVEPSAASSDGSSSGVSVLHRVLAFEDHKQAPDACDPPDSDIIPLPAALSHSLSGTWKQRIDDKGKPVWQRDAREAASDEVTRLCLAASCMNEALLVYTLVMITVHHCTLCGNPWPQMRAQAYISGFEGVSTGTQTNPPGTRHNTSADRLWYFGRATDGKGWADAATAASSAVFAASQGTV